MVAAVGGSPVNEEQRCVVPAQVTYSQDVNEWNIRINQSIQKKRKQNS